MSPTTGTRTESSARSPEDGSRRNIRTSIGRDIDAPLRRKPLSSRLARCLDTDDGDRSPTASPISRVLGEYPYRVDQSRMATRIRCWRTGRVEVSRSRSS